MLRKNKLDSIEILISKTLIDWFISHDEFVSISNVLREYNESKKWIKGMETYCIRCKRYTSNTNSSVKFKID